MKIKNYYKVLLITLLAIISTNCNTNRVNHKLTQQEIRDLYPSPNAPIENISPAPSFSLAPQTPTPKKYPTYTPTPHPLSIEAMRKYPYENSELVFEETLDQGYNYQRYIVSYHSDGLKIYAYLTIPNEKKPPASFPIIIFNHGYIPPAEYRSTERYVAYVDAFARRGYIVFRSDYRGHGNSEGTAVSAYLSPAYTIDVLNGLNAVKRLPQADPNRIGMWGHSMGGYITLRSMVITKDIKAGVIWAGVVAPYPDLFSQWRTIPTQHALPTLARRWIGEDLWRRFGLPADEPQYWAMISANTYLKDLSGPVQLHHGTQDGTVPIAFSEQLYKQIKAEGGIVEFYPYAGDNHNLSENFSLAMYRSIAFFNKYVKNAVLTEAAP